MWLTELTAGKRPPPHPPIPPTPPSGSDLPLGLGGQACQWGFVCLVETINITGNFPISESGRKFQAVFSCLFAFFFFLAACGVPGGQARGFSGPLEHLPAAHGARGAREPGGGSWNCVFLQALGKQNLVGSWAGLGQRNQTGCGRLAPDSLVILEDKDLQGACKPLSHWLWGWGDECVDMSGPGIASLCPLGSFPAGNLVTDIRHT